MAPPEPVPPPDLLCEHGEEECVCAPDARDGCLWAFPAQRREVPA